MRVFAAQPGWLARALQAAVKSLPPPDVPTGVSAVTALPRFPAAVLLLVLAACASGPRSASDSLPLDARAETVQLAAAKDNLDAADAMDPPPAAATPATMAGAQSYAPVQVASQGTPALTGHGYAQVSGQPGKTHNEKRLMAMRAARLDAMRDLVEQIHGIRLTAETTVSQAVVQSDSLQALVDGTLRGAKTVSIQPTGSDSYEVILSISADTLAYLVRALRGQI
jgi:hypothetical protein